MSKPARLSLAGVVCAALLAVTAASASAAMTVSLGQPTLTARVAIKVPATVSCDPFDPSLTYFDDSVIVSVEQAAGRDIAKGTGSAFGFLPNLVFACDSAPHTVSVDAAADASGPPFHGGRAAFSATANALAGFSCGNGCFFNLAGQSATSGSMTFNLH